MKHALIASFFASATLASLSPTHANAQEAKTAQPATATQTAVATKQPNTPPATVRVVDPTADKNEALVSISFEETPLVDVIKAFRDATGANIISSGTNLQGTVSVRLDNVPWRKGLGSILEPQGLQLVEQPINSGIFVVTTKTVEVPMTTQTFSLNCAKADDVAKLFASTIGKGGTATPFPSANVVIVTATDQKISECEKIIKTIDVPRTQVYIEARFAELSAGASRKLGVKWDEALGKTDTDDGYIIEHANATILKYGKNHSTAFGGTLTPQDFSLTLNAFDQIDGASVFSNPKIIVANEETATVDMTTKEPNLEVTVQQATSTSGKDTVTTKLAIIPGKEETFVGEAFYSYGITLKVTPRVSATGLITVQIEPSISDKDVDQGVDGYFTITDAAAKYPIIKMQRLKTVFTMQSGTTAVIGGLSRTTERNTDSGIPYLRKIPWIGPYVFGWKSRDKEQKEIVIFVTVGIADPLNLKENIGVPKNAILGQEILSGKSKEPGDRTKEDLMSLDDPTQPHAQKDQAAAATSTENAPASAAPASAGPRPKNP